MRRLVFLLIPVAAASLAHGAPATPSGVAPSDAAAAATPAPECTVVEKARRQRALTGYRRRMAAERRAFFRAHTSVRARRAFVRRQQAKLGELRRAAACTVIPAAARLVATIPIANDGGVGIGNGSVWVIDRPGRRLLRIDPATNRVVAEVAGVAGAAPVVGEGVVWVASGISLNTLLRVDPDTGAVTRIATGPSEDEWPITAVVALGAVWVGNHHGGTVVRVDPATNRVVASVPWGEHGGGGPYHMATDGSSIWVTASRNAEVAEIDTATNSIVRRTPVPVAGTCGGVTVDASAVWVTSGYDPAFACGSWFDPPAIPTYWGVVRVDRSTGAATRIDVGGRPIDIRTAFGSVWVVVDLPRLQLVRLDPTTYRVTGRLHLAAQGCTPQTHDACADFGTAMEVGFGSLWIRTGSAASGGAGRLLRVQPIERALACGYCR